MTILREIHVWAKGLAAWQQDAVARLYITRTLSDRDLDDLYALSKRSAGIADSEGRVPKPLQDADVALSADPTRSVQIAGIKDVANVNALANDGKLPVALTGLTVIYGENGAGKSGYSRIFKHACRARDRSERILPDAKLDPKTVGAAKAVFETLIDGVPTDLAWVYGEPSPDALADFSIFDSHCARAYIDNDGDFAYAPYGLDILEGLVSLCDKLKKRATEEKLANAPSNAAYVALSGGQTAVARMLGGIPGKTKPEDIEALATLSDIERARLEVLVKILAETDPKQKAQTLRQQILRLNGLKDRISAAVEIVSKEKLDQLRGLINNQKTAREAADLAAAGFKALPGQLSGTGGDEWKELFAAARAFAAISHAEHVFPNLPKEAACPLCQNVLGAEGSERLVQFDTFIKQRAEQAALETRRTAEDSYKIIHQASLNLALEEALQQELLELDPATATACAAMQASLTARQAAVRLAAGTKLAWNEVPDLANDPRPSLDTIAVGLQTKAKALEDSADEKAKAAMIAEHLELDARRKLGDVKVAVLEAIEKHEYCRKLQTCISGMGTTAISKKCTELSNTMARQEVADALNEELKKLKVHELKIVMKPESPKGRTKFKLILELPGGGAPAAILSEGEQRAIALASFFAETKLARGCGGVVFDDPVSSLDHRRRWEVAERLAKEALTRQVIVFTHDIYFLCILEQKATEAKADLAKSYLRRTPAGFGVHSQDLPFDVLGTKERIGRLRVALQNIKQAQHSNDEDAHRTLTADAYGELRLSWERAVEEVLFNGAIQRFGEGVSTQLLKAVTVTDEDYRKIYDGMTKCSKFEHDAAMRVGRLPVPDPDELSADIEGLEAWRKATVERQKALRAART